MDKQLTSPLGFGCVKLSTHSSQKAAMMTLKVAYDAGIRWFDTAPLYGQGYSEAILGKFIRTLSSADRAELKIVSKFGLGPSEKRLLHLALALPLNRLSKTLKSSTKHPSPKPQRPIEGIKPRVIPTRQIRLDQIKAQLDATIRRLGIEQLHGYLAHEALPRFIEPEGRNFLLNMRKKGRIRYIGIGTGAENLLADIEADYSWIDILQYEGWGHEEVRQLLDAFPDQQHVHHSIMKFFSSEQQEGPSPLALHAAQFPKAQILFSSSNPEHIRGNAMGFSTCHF